MRRGVGATVLAIVAVILLAVPSSAFAASDTTADSGTTGADMVTYTGELECLDTTSGTDPVRVLIIAARMDTSSGSSESIWYYDTKPYEGTAAYNQDKKCWEFSVEVPAITLGSGYRHFLCVQDGYGIWRVPADTMAYSPSTDSQQSPSYTPYTLSPDPKATWEYPMPPYSAYRIVNSSIHIAGQTVDLTESSRIVLRSATVTVTGTVTSEKNYALSNAEIGLARASDPDKVIYRTATDGSGMFSISNVPTGEYILTVNVAGYSCDPISVDIQDNVSNRFSVTMAQDADTQYFGFDLPHFLMLLGGVVCVILILASAVFQHRARKGKRDQWIADDTEE